MLIITVKNNNNSSNNNNFCSHRQYGKIVVWLNYGLYIYIYRQETIFKNPNSINKF